MKVTKTELEGVLIIEPDVHGDHRGWFTESYNKQEFLKHGIDIDFVQDNHSFSAQKGTLRGIHFQIEPKAQTKLVRCTRGKVLDVAVDLRKESPTFKKWIYIELSTDNHVQLLIPKGFGHAFLTLSEETEIQYKVDEYYSKEHDRSVVFNDTDLNINWNVYNPILSDKDKIAPSLKSIFYL